jgi:hypothetical protein
MLAPVLQYVQTAARKYRSLAQLFLDVMDETVLRQLLSLRPDYLAGMSDETMMFGDLELADSSETDSPATLRSRRTVAALHAAKSGHVAETELGKDDRNPNASGRPDFLPMTLTPESASALATVTKVARTPPRLPPIGNDAAATAGEPGEPKRWSTNDPHAIHEAGDSRSANTSPKPRELTRKVRMCVCEKEGLA